MNIKLILAILLFVMSTFLNAATLKKSSNEIEKLIQISFYNINNLDTYRLKKDYNITLRLNIADGILIFKYDGNEELGTLIKKVKSQEKDIKSIKRYKRYNFRAY